MNNLKSVLGTDQDKENGWESSVDLIIAIETTLTFPAHPIAIEQILLYLVKNGYCR